MEPLSLRPAKRGNACGGSDSATGAARPHARVLLSAAALLRMFLSPTATAGAAEGRF